MSLSIESDEVEETPSYRKRLRELYPRFDDSCGTRVRVKLLYCLREENLVKAGSDVVLPPDGGPFVYLYYPNVLGDRARRLSRMFLSPRIMRQVAEIVCVLFRRNVCGLRSLFSNMCLTPKRNVVLFPLESLEPAPEGFDHRSYIQGLFRAVPNFKNECIEGTTGMTVNEYTALMDPSAGLDRVVGILTSFSGCM